MPLKSTLTPDTRWLARRTGGKEEHRLQFNAGNQDSQYQRDRARIVHSAAFRALQSKTQVLGLGENDFYRTRLTHSLEVAQVGSGIVEHLHNNAGESSRNWLPTVPLMDAICLAHDLGHPPFGHGGEVSLNAAMLPYGGFEGNGQTLRILSRLGEFSEHCGIDVTRRTMLGVIKYPVPYSKVANYAEELSNPRPLNLQHWHPPKCVYDDELDVLDWVFEPFEAADIERLQSVQARDGAHAKTLYKALDVSIMEIADDIAYGIHDLEDALALRLISRERWMGDFAEKAKAIGNNPLSEDFDFYTDRLLSEEPHRRKHAISRLVNYMIINTNLQCDESFEHPLLSLQAKMQPEARALLDLCQRFVFDEVILRPEILAVRHRGQRAMLSLFDTLLANPNELLPRSVYAKFEASDHPPRILCDYLSGLTDVSAAKLYRRLTLPGEGSIFDMI